MERMLLATQPHIVMRPIDLDTMTTSMPMNALSHGIEWTAEHMFLHQKSSWPDIYDILKSTGLVNPTRSPFERLLAALVLPAEPYHQLSRSMRQHHRRCGGHTCP